MGAARKSAERGVIGEVSNRVQRAWGESPFYQLQLNGPAPDRVLSTPVDPCTPDLSLGEAVLAARLTIGPETLDGERDIARLWALASASQGPASVFLQQFAFLPACDALGESAAEKTRRLITHWLDRYEKWSPEAWAPALAAERLTQLCCHSAFLLKGADALWRSRLLSSMARQARHLANVGHCAETGHERLMTALGLSLAALVMPGCEDPAEKGLELLRRELRLQIRPDGGHVSRNPSLQLTLVIRLQMILKALEARRMEAPAFLRHTLGRAAANLQFFRAGDGDLAVFNGGYEDDARALEAALQALDPETTPTGFARHTGYHRLESARTLLIADAGGAPAPRHFESAASFHLSAGRARIVGNCGSGAHLGGDWAKALKQAAAHSSLSAETAGGAAVVAMQFGAAEHRRAEDARGQLVEIERRFGSTDDAPRHLRRLYLQNGGDQVKGEDHLILPTPALARSFRVRFHLHPSVKASLARDGKSVILALANREGWRFRSNFRGLKLEKSVYCGARAAIDALFELQTP
ncbi:MAG: heparinase II/III family protein, partial [Parvularculaceae bacterium]